MRKNSSTSTITSTITSTSTSTSTATSSEAPQLATLSAPTQVVVRLAHAARRLSILAAIASVVALVIAMLAAEGLLDALARFPALLRMAMLVGMIALITLNVRKVLLPALRWRVRPVDIALRIERARPELRGRLASALEFELSGTAHTSPLAARAVSDLVERARGVDLGTIIRRRPALLRVAAALLAITGVMLCAWSDPHSTSIALRRALTPWSAAVWPARTNVESLLRADSVAARGRPLPLRARLTKGDVENERVRAEYRLHNGGVEGAWMEVVLARQPDGNFERLVDTDGDAIEVRFLSSDATTETMRVQLIEPPSITRAVASIKPPLYAERVISTRSEDLGNGRDGRATVRDAVLAGSRVTLDLQLNRAIRPRPSYQPLVFTATTDGIGDGLSGTTERVLEQPTLLIDPTDASRWTISLTAREPVRVAVELIDADGITQDEPIVFAFDVSLDRAPSATISQPEQDESVVVDATIALRSEARDDFELRSAGVEIATRIGTASMDSLVFEEAAVVNTGATEAFVESNLELARLRLSPGDSVMLRAFAEDLFDGVDASGNNGPGRGHGRVHSAPRMLRVVAEEEFERQIRSALAGVRRDAMRIDERQARARDVLERDASDATLAQSQGAVTEGIALTRESVEHALDRLARNGRDQGVLAELTEQARELTEAAEQRSAQANDAITQAQRTQDPLKRAEAVADAAKHQEEVRAELEDLVGLLDRDEDSWVARRRLDALAERIRQLARETQQAAQRSHGETREELSPEARAELDQLAAKQDKAAEEAEQVIAELHERSKALQEADAPQARALDEAAKAAEDGRVRQEMEQAADDAQQNRLAQSKDAQDRAAAALGKASAALAQDRKVRAEELARLFETLIKSIGRLIEQTKERSAELPAAAIDEVQREGLAMSVGKLSQNTRGIAADARSNGREAARIARLLDAAAGSHAAVSSALRRVVFEANDAQLAMESALKSLHDALAQAEEAEQRAQDRAEEEKRDELVAKYRDLLEREAAVRAAVEKIIPLNNTPLGRREQIESRRLGTVQEELRIALDTLRASEEDIKSSDAFVEMHEVIDVALIEAKSNLSGGHPTEAMPHVSEALEGVAAMVAALDDDAGADDEDPFGEQQGGEQGGEGGSGGNPAGAVPPAAEIKLLRAMQDSVARRTRALDDAGNTLDAITRAQRIGEIAAKQQRILELGSKIAEKLAPEKNGAATLPATSTTPPPTGKPKPSESNTPPNGSVDLQPSLHEQFSRSSVYRQWCAVFPRAIVARIHNT